MLAVDFIALVAALFDPFSLYVVLLLYWGDLIGGTVRRFCQTVVAAPREKYSPTKPPAMARNGDPNPFRFLTPKLGTVQPINWLPPVALHNLKPAVMGLFIAAPLTALAVGLTATALDPPFTLRSWPTVGILAAGGLAIIAKHGWTFLRFVRSDRPPAEEFLPSLRWVGTLLMALPVVAVDTIHAGADFDPSAGFAAIATVLVVGRIAYATRHDTEQAGADSFELSAPTGRPVQRFRTDRPAVWIAGMSDGIVPRIEWDVRNIFSRLAAIFLVVAGWFFGSFFVGVTAATVGASIGFIAFAAAFALVGIAHFELAFGAMEYRLYDDELVAYDARLDAVQWRVPLDAIKSVSVKRGFWTAPPGTDAAAVALDRADLTVEQMPYGFYRQTLMYVENPERVADHLRRETVRRRA